MKLRFEWDAAKDLGNQAKHYVPFVTAQEAFLDPHRVIAEDVSHGGLERRCYCIARVGAGILTVRFTLQRRVIRIFGAGYWRKGKRVYEKQNKIHG
jgi:hypothetical protein